MKIVRLKGQIEIWKLHQNLIAKIRTYTRPVQVLGLFLCFSDFENLTNFKNKCILLPLKIHVSLLK